MVEEFSVIVVVELPQIFGLTVSVGALQLRVVTALEAVCCHGPLINIGHEYIMLQTGGLPTLDQCQQPLTGVIMLLRQFPLKH